MKEICEKGKCSACGACVNKCPKNAITLKEDRVGRTIYDIDEAKCVNCGICQKVCPNLTKNELLRAPHAIACYRKEEKERDLSSSGGAATALSEYVISQGGVVFGVHFSNKKCGFVRMETVEELVKMKGSKYVQSETGNIYKAVLEDLLKSRLVLFIGSPCEVAGLLGFLQKPYDNLITVDLICHGMPPVSYLKKHLEEQKVKAWDQVAFRGEYDWYLTAKNAGKVVYQESRFEDYYFKAFLMGTIFRENCYNCSFARPERVSDFTVGDFWGLDKEKISFSYDGRVSVILPNTQKARTVFEECKELFVYDIRPFSEALTEYQWNLKAPSIKPKERKVFLKLYPILGFKRSLFFTRTGFAIFVNSVFKKGEKNE